MEELEQHIEQIPQAEKYELLGEAKANPSNFYLYIDTFGKPPRIKTIPENIIFLGFADLEKIEKFEQHTTHKAHLQMPLGLLHGHMSPLEIKERIDMVENLIKTIYPTIEVGGYLTITDLLLNEMLIRDDLLKQSGFVPIGIPIPAGLHKYHILVKILATKP